jgi:hypothetical protein
LKELALGETGLIPATNDGRNVRKEIFWSAVINLFFQGFNWLMTLADLFFSYKLPRQKEKQNGRGQPGH